ncbi:MAG TPA: porin family protein [Flavitalea sp.]|nr:porin family protein [Flavitalea sp.]
MKTYILLFSFVLGALSVSAQDVHPHFGIKGGVNIANLNLESDADLSSKTSFYLGGLAHLHISQHFAIQPELMYSGQGAKYDETDDKINLNYITLPILAQYMTGSGFRLETGPQVGALVSAKVKHNDNSTDIKDEYKKIDFSWAFGAGYVSNSGLGIDARYNLGLSNINDGTSKIKNNVFQIGLFYQFGVSNAAKDTRK